jgi:hypothetical protein
MDLAERIILAHDLCDATARNRYPHWLVQRLAKLLRHAVANNFTWRNFYHVGASCGVVADGSVFEYV